MDAYFVFDHNRASFKFSDPLFKCNVILDENFTVTLHKKRELWMRQSWAVGFSILELSKLIMQRLYYDEIKPAFNNRTTIAMSDTDSMLILAPAESSDKIVQKLSHIIDFSTYSEDHPLYDASKKKKVGIMSNECPHDELTAFVGIRSKSYAIKTASQQMKSRAKGVSKRYKDKISFEAYKKCIDNIEAVTVRQMNLQSKNHRTFLIESRRVGFSSLCDKRHIFVCGKHSCPYGSILIEYEKRTGQCYFCDNPHVFV